MEARPKAPTTTAEAGRPARPRPPAARPRTPAGRARLSSQRLATEYPGTAAQLCELDFSTPWQLLVATVLSAQTTDERVNSVTPTLFTRYPDVADLAAAEPAAVEQLIYPTGFFRVKARALVALAQALCERFDGQVPASRDELVTLPGVGRKTANVVLSVGFGLPGLPVDTHVGRLSRLLALTAQTDPDKVEAELCAALPSREWGPFSLRMILHGRRVCIARRPRCPECVLADFCPSAALPIQPSKLAKRAGVARAGKEAKAGKEARAGKKARAATAPKAALAKATRPRPAPGA